MRVNYYEYIQSAAWRQHANEAKRRAGNRCQICNRPSSEVVLNAHHRTYERLGNESPDDITVLCRDCHELYETNKKLPRLPAQPAFSPPKQPAPQTVATHRTLAQEDDAGRWGPATIFGIVAIIAIVALLGMYVQAVVRSTAQVAPPTAIKSVATIQPTGTLSAIVTETPVVEQSNGTLKQSATLYQGPAISYPTVGTLAIGTKVLISGYTICNPDTWYQIGKDRWVAVSLVDTGQLDIPYLTAPCILPTARPQPTATNTTQPTATRTPANTGAVNRNANIRNGPGTGYPVARGTTRGTKVTITGVATCGAERWYRIGDREWIASFLVDGISSSIPVLDIECINATPTPIPPTATALPPLPTATFPQPTVTSITRTCAAGCTTYPTWCDPAIKGNVSYETSEKIYHVPGQEYYSETRINPSYGERWFCTEDEALSAGWRKSKR